MPQRTAFGPDRRFTMNAMDIASPSPLLGGLSPAAFMKRHWQRKPLLIRQAMPGAVPPLGRTALLALAARENVQSRLVEQRDGPTPDAWTLRHGPFTRRALPPLRRPGWTLLVQGVDLHVDAARALLSRFRFAPDARLDDLMLSFATDGGGVGPHVDSYDVFLLQLQGRRQWRIGRAADRTVLPGLPLKILANFVAEEEWVLEPGDMLYLPPGWAHDGTALGECTTASIGFRAATRDEVAVQVLQRLLDGAADDAVDSQAEPNDAGPVARGRAARRPPRYRDAGQPATAHPGRMPALLGGFAADAVARLLAAPHAIDRALGEWLSEPPPNVWYDEPAALHRDSGVRLDRRTRMLYDERHVFVNGESFRAGGRDAGLLRLLADRRRLSPTELSRLSAPTWQLVAAWALDGWLVNEPPSP